MLPLAVQHPKDEHAHVGTCERTKRHIHLCYNEFIGLPPPSAAATTPSTEPTLPKGMTREDDRSAAPTAEDVATGAAALPLPVILLIMGVASPGMFWDDRFCSALAQSGPYRVIRFDNRDVGLSTHLDDENGDGVEEDADRPFATPSTSPQAAVHASNAGEEEEEAPAERASASPVSSFLSNVFGRGRGASRAAAAAAAPPSTTNRSAGGTDDHQKSKHAPDYLRFAYAAMNPGKRVIPETYTIEDMAKDALGLLDALNVRTAHVVGMCLGGMIAQCMAIRAPERVASLTLFATHTSDAHGVKWPSMMTMLSMIRCAPRSSIYTKYKPIIEAAGTTGEKQRLEKERDAARAKMYAEALTKLLDMLAGDKEKIGFDHAGTLRLMERAFQRSLYVLGSGRQVVATLNSSPRGAALRRAITSQPGTAASGSTGPRYVPTVILQGTKDSICPAENARELSECIPGSRVVWLEGCGHILPPLYRQQILTSVQSVVVEGERARTAASGPGAPPVVRSHL